MRREDALEYLTFLVSNREGKSKRFEQLLLWDTSWEYWVPEHFRVAMDILYTPRNNGKAWTQGANFNFAAGYIIYREGKKAPVQVLESAGASVGNSGFVRYYFPGLGNYLTDFFECTQDDFVRMLIGGQNERVSLIP